MKRFESIRVQQTALFVVVVLIALALLAPWVLGALSAQVADWARAQQVTDARAVAEVVGNDLPLDVGSREVLQRRVERFGEILGDDVRVYGRDGARLAARETLPVPQPDLGAAVDDALAGRTRSAADVGYAGLVLASAPVRDASGRVVAAVVISNRGTLPRGTLDVARRQFAAAMLVTLLVSGLVGFLVSDFIARQARRILASANAVAEGDFSRRLERGPFPGEIRELVEAFNRMAARLGEAFETLSGQERAQREFVANASHELRTPIAALKGGVEMLERAGTDSAEERASLLASMRLEVSRLQRLVDNLFTLSQVDSGRLHLQLSSQPANDIVQVVATAMGPLANASGVALQADTPDEEVSVLADRDFITQVLVGLVDNAVKHSKPGDIVTVAVSPLDGHARLSVSDTGPGIPAEVVPHIFDRFYTQRRSEQGHRRGSGLGLAIAEEIVEAHGSHIDLETREGAGTTFRFDLARG